MPESIAAARKLLASLLTMSTHSGSYVASDRKPKWGVRTAHQPRRHLPMRTTAVETHMPRWVQLFEPKLWQYA
jgi:hypothetical protein